MGAGIGAVGALEVVVGVVAAYEGQGGEPEAVGCVWWSGGASDGASTSFEDLSVMFSRS